MTLSPVDLRILAAVELHADRSAAEIARIARTKATVVYRTIHRLIDRNVIVGRTAIVDLAQLGLIEFGVNLALAPRDPRTREVLVQKLRKTPNVSWISEVGGSLDLMCNIVAESPHRAQRILDVLLEEFSDSILRRQICARSRRVRYPRWFLGLQRQAAPRFVSGEQLFSQKIEEVDRRMLIALSEAGFESFRDIAQTLRIPLSTFLRRIQNLKRRKILLGFGYRFDLNRIDALQFRVLLSFRTVRKTIRERLYALAGRERAIKLVVECFGNWDFELEIDQPRGDDVKRVTSLLHHEFHGDLMELTLIPIFRHLQYVSFPAVNAVS